jgi:hypothetical protein
MTLSSLIKNNCLAVFLILVVCSSCKKNAAVPTYYPSYSPCVTTYKQDIDTFLIQNFLFKAGTYWVYQDSISGRIDSLYTYGFKKTWGSYFQGPSSPGTGGCTTHYRYAWDSINYVPDPNHTQYWQYTYYLQGNTIHYNNPYGICTIILCNSSGGSLKPQTGYQYYPTFQVGTNTYTNVYKYAIPAECGSPTGYLYLKPGLGLVQADLFNSGGANHALFKLLRFHIAP